MNLNTLETICSNYKVPNITIDFMNTIYNSIQSKQSDNARYVLCTLTENGIIRTLKDDEKPRIRMEKPDHTYIYNDCEKIIDNSSKSDGRVLIHFTDQMLAVHGNAVCDIQLVSGNNSYSTQNFVVNIAPLPFDETSVKSTNEFQTLLQLMIDTEEAADYADQSAVYALETARRVEETAAANEAVRGQAESSRAANENNRITAESNRIYAENSRSQAEQARTYAETIREQNETIRIRQQEARENYSDSWKGSLLPKGSIPFSQLPSSGNLPGHMYNINEAFVTDGRFKNGAGYSYPAGTNVYWTTGGKWDCLSGNLTVELTQAEYDALPEAEKMNGTIYYISDADNTLSFASESIPGVVVVDAALSGSSKNPVQNRTIANALNQKADSESPDFTGIPNAPTASTNTNSSQIATTAFVKAVVNGLVNGAPETLDTLKELADAIVANESVVAALNSAIGNKVDKISGKGLSEQDFTTEYKSKLDGIAAEANSYTLPPASASVRGGVKTGYSQNGNNYPVQLSNEQMFVHVPWTDTNTQSITGVKGSAETSYRTGNVNLTPENIGTFPAKILTQAQYNALPDAEKSSETIYFITD